MAWRSFIAMGDSFTEGLDDPLPVADTYRGWADLVAERLADHEPDFAYANLAVRGKLFEQAAREQLPVALVARPDLMSFAAGGNDALRRSFDGPRFVRRIDEVIGQMRATGADVLVFRFIDLSRRLPGRRIVQPRTRLLNDAAADSGRRHGAKVVDLWADGEFDNPLLWSADRLHLSPAGHRRVAAHVLTVLGLPVDPAWWRVPPGNGPVSWPRRRADDLRWAGQHLVPWVRRRMAGQSSGDEREPKRPTLAPLR
jgi:lysophospholipase L1-like esterase